MEAAGVRTLLSVARLQPSFWPAAWVFEPAAVRAEKGVPSVTAFRLTHPAPRAYVAASWRTAESADAAARLLFADEVDGLPATVITRVAGVDLPPAPPAVTGRLVAPTVEITRDQEQLVELIVNTDAEALLVLLDANAPGWRATVTGAPAPIYTANVAFRAVAVPAGRHVVRFEYRPPGWGAALALTTSGSAVLVLWAIWVLSSGGGRFMNSRSVAPS